jgi:hypothetical protein
LLPNDLIIFRNYRDDEEDERDIKRALERQGDAHIKVEIQSNSEFQSLTSSPSQSPEPPWLPMAVVPGPNKIGFDQNYWKNLISRVQLIQELNTLKLMHMSHMRSNWGILGLLGKVSK